MIKKLLIANRGEIACRIIGTAKRMSMETIAVYSEADANARHVRMADQSVCIGPASATESYLNSCAIVEAAKTTGAHAIHPGYGFLAENAEFAETVRAAGLICVGPPTQAIRDMAAKDHAKAIMTAANVPVVPGYYGSDQSLKRLAQEARQVGYPILLKAALGGGGKGMRIVQKQSELKDAVDGARREALSAFGDDRLLIERYLTKTRHIEIQVFADQQGNVVHLFERDCSLQRRHQKVIEEAPAPGMSVMLREEMGAAAIAAAKAVAYEGAGTVEFLLAPDNSFYFMEMNTRLQVEHPVSEFITGLDFVEWQLRIADGEPLPLQQADITLTGHAVEARLYAEDAENSFLPVPGQIRHLKWPDARDNLRIDSGVDEGDVVSPYYDPMIAKIIGYGETRTEAIASLVDALHQIEIMGPGQNIRFLIYLLNSKSFSDGTADTATVDGLIPADFAVTADQKNGVLLAVANQVFQKPAQNTSIYEESPNDAHSPWGENDGWRLGGEFIQSIRLGLNGCHYRISKKARAGATLFEINGELIDTSSVEGLKVISDGKSFHVFDACGPMASIAHELEDIASSTGAFGNSFAAPMPGKITAVHVACGDKVTAGDILVVLEAMKMEHTISAPKAGVIESVFVKVGEQIDEGVELLTMRAI